MSTSRSPMCCKANDDDVSVESRMRGHHNSAVRYWCMAFVFLRNVFSPESGFPSFKLVLFSSFSGGNICLPVISLRIGVFRLSFRVGASRALRIGVPCSLPAK